MGRFSSRELWEKPSSVFVSPLCRSDRQIQAA